MTWEKLTPAERERWLARANQTLKTLKAKLPSPMLAYVDQDTARLTTWTEADGTRDHGIVKLEGAGDA